MEIRLPSRTWEKGKNPIIKLIIGLYVVFMEFKKLPSNSKEILDEILQSDNPAQMLCERFESASRKEDEELRGILKELREEGFVNVNWASNKPYLVNISNSARTYNERLAEYEKMMKERVIYNIETVNNNSVNIGNQCH